MALSTRLLSSLNPSGFKFLVLIVASLGVFSASHMRDGSANAASSATSVDWSQLGLAQLDGTPVNMEELKGKVVLVVNVASRCGYTSQYSGLQALYEEKSRAGFTIVGVPCNQFGGQEPGNAEEIKSFCTLNYGVKFPLLQKQDVNGAKRSLLYKALVHSGPGNGKDVSWNFEKFLIGRTGSVEGRFRSGVAPDSTELLAAIDKAIAVQAKAH
jgi:glutathione peroxidase